MTLPNFGSDFYLGSPSINSRLANCNCPATEPGPTLATSCGGSAFVVFMGLLEVFIRSQCDIEDPCNRPKHRLALDKDYDFIVVGGGSAGAVVAARLSEIPFWKVLLIEAGTDEPTGTQIPSMFLNFLGSSIDWGFKTEPEEMACLASPEQRCYWPRGKVLGGTSAINGMMYIRGSRTDYDNWARSGNHGWSYDEVMPYFLKSEDNQQMSSMDRGFHSTGGPLTVTEFPYHPPMSRAIVEAAAELGYPTRDLNGKKHTGFMIAQTTSRNGSRLSTAKAFLRPTKDRPNLHILLNTTATKVLINPKTKTAYGVEILVDGLLKEVFVRNEVILSGGAVNSPQLLLLSGVGPKEDLKEVGVPSIHHLSSVGRNLHNHVAFFLNFYLNENSTTHLNWATAMEYLLFRDGLMSGTGISEVTGFINTKLANSSDDHPDVQYFFGGYLADCSKTGQVGESVLNEDGVEGRRVINIIPAVLHPKSRGYLKLKDSNPLSHPAIYGKYLTHPDDVTRLIEGIRFGIKLAETKALKKYGFELNKKPIPGCEMHSFGSDEYWECAVRRKTGPENHQGGSCKMAPAGDPTACVDPELKVVGIERLRVIDASIMPTITSGNTNAPVIMIAEKGADMIKHRWLKKKVKSVGFK